MVRLLLTLGLLAIVLMFYALFDVLRADEDESRGVSKWVWVLAVLLLPVVGAVLWLVLGKVRRSDDGPGGPGRGPSGPRPGGSGPVRRVDDPAPDDDPDFLRRLGRPHDQNPGPKD